MFSQHLTTNAGFICAEVMAFEDLKEFGTELEVKAKGKYRQEGETTNFFFFRVGRLLGV